MRKLIIFAVINILIAGSLTHARELSRADFVEEINILFLKGDYKGLIKEQEGNLRQYRLGIKNKKEILYLTGLSYLKLGNFLKAKEHFYKVLKMRGNEWREASLIGIADSYFEEKDFGKAIEKYENLLIMYPESERRSGVYYNLGISYKEKNNTDKANSYFKRLKEHHGTSFEADRMSLSSEENGPEFYIIQLGAFNELRNAKKLVRKLSRKKHDSYIQKARKGGKVLYRVRGGKFSNKYYARRLVRKLKRDGFPAKIIVE